MSNTIRRFDFELLGGKSAGLSPAVVITIQRVTSHEDALCISPNLMTEKEIDDHIAALKSDLDAVAQRAKAAFRKSN